MEPDPSVHLLWKTVEDAVKWVEMEGDLASPHSEAGSLLALLGAKPNTPIRTLGAIEDSLYEDITKQWQPGGSAPTPIQASQAALLGRASRIAAGQQLSEIEKKLALEKKEKAEQEVKLAEMELRKKEAEAAAAASAKQPSANGKKENKDEHNRRPNQRPRG